MEVVDSNIVAADPPPIDGLETILSWSATAPAWQKDALRRLCAGPDLEASDEAELLEILKGTRPADPVSDQHIRQKAATHQTVALKSIKDATFVNALAPNQTCSFSQKGMTIVYGDNGSGKSGYVRILKAACRARLDKGFDILPDIYTARKSDVPHASLTFFEGPTRTTTTWTKGTPAVPALSAISVFDSSNIIPDNTLYAEFDEYFSDRNPAEDALIIAAALQNDPSFPEGAAEIAERLNWPPRRLNPALAYLVERKIVQDTNFIGGGKFVATRISRTDATRRFVKSRT